MVIYWIYIDVYHLVGCDWNMDFIFPYIWNNHPKWQTHIFQRGWNHQPGLLWWWLMGMGLKIVIFGDDEWHKLLAMTSSLLWNIAMYRYSWWIYPLNMVIFLSYVKLPKGTLWEWLTLYSYWTMAQLKRWIFPFNMVIFQLCMDLPVF